MKRIILLTIAGVVAAATTSFALEDRVLEFPADYKTAFTKYYNNDRLLAEEQTISLYANDIAKTGAQADGKLPDGSVLVAEIFAAKKDADGEVIESSLGHRLSGEMKAIVVMERRAAWADQYADGMKLGGWEFEVFSTKGENLAKDTASCRECHAPLGDSEFMFSLEHLIAAQ